MGISIIAFGLILVKSIKKNNAYKKEPILSVQAKVVTKRTYNHLDFSTAYYVTFQVDSGDRMELAANMDLVGYIVEGDTGILTFQGDKLVSFK